MIAFHCTNRAGGASVALPDFAYGPCQRDHSRPGSSVFPERTKNSRRGSFELAEDFAEAADGGLHHSRRPHCENSCASKERDSNVPSASYSGPTEKILPGFAVHKKTLPEELRAMPVICADPDLARWAKTPRPSTVRRAPALPVPARRRPWEGRPRV